MMSTIKTSGIGSAHLQWRPMAGSTRFGTTRATMQAISLRNCFIRTARMPALLGRPM
jgi:hypothetical protein